MNTEETTAQQPEQPQQPQQPEPTPETSAEASKESIQASRQTLKLRPLNVPRWGGRVHLAEMSGVDRDLLTEAWDRYRKAFNGSEESWANYQAFLCAWCVRDKRGKRFFCDQEVLALSQTPAAELNAVADEIERINGLGKYASEVLPKSSAAGPKG